MQVSVELFDLPAESAGELLLTMINPKQRWGYMTRKTSYRTWDTSVSVLPEKIVKHFWCDQATVHVVDLLFTRGYLQWDGDGVLVFVFEDRLLVNQDVKKGQWEWKQ